MASSEVLDDLENNHGRKASRFVLRDLADVVASIAQAKEETWSYDIPQLPRPVATVSLGLDGANLRYYEGFRIAMCGTITLYDKSGERLHTTYCAAAPEYGMQTFIDRFSREIQKVKARFPDAATYVGVADGAPESWKFLEPLTSVQVLDFYHVSEYVADALFPAKKNNPDRSTWIESRLHSLKHEPWRCRKTPGRAGTCGSREQAVGVY